MTHHFDNLLNIDYDGAIAIVAINRAAKRNALNAPLVRAIQHCFESFAPEVKVAIIGGHGEHFCAGLDLSELRECDTSESMHPRACGMRLLSVFSSVLCR